MGSTQPAQKCLELHYFRRLPDTASNQTLTERIITKKFWEVFLSFFFFFLFLVFRWLPMVVIRSLINGDYSNFQKPKYANLNSRDEEVTACSTRNSDNSIVAGITARSGDNSSTETKQLPRQQSDPLSTVSCIVFFFILFYCLFFCFCCLMAVRKQLLGSLLPLSRLECRTEWLQFHQMIYAQLTANTELWCLYREGSAAQYMLKWNINRVFILRQTRLAVLILTFGWHQCFW